MQFAPLDLVSAISVAKRMRAMDWRCLEAVTTIGDAEFFGLNRWQTDGAAWAMLDDHGLPIAMGGISMSVPWVGTVWMVCTDDMCQTSWKKLVRHGRKVLVNAAKAIPRLEAHVLEGWGQAEKFAERHGFRYEGTRYRAGRDGQNIKTYVYQG